MEPTISQQEEKKRMATTPFWYAMRVTYRREMKIQESLRLCGTPSFIPMYTRTVKKDRRIVHITEPAVHSLIFIFASQEWIQEFKASRPELQYIMTKEGSTSHKTIVPLKQMEDFMAVCENNDPSLHILPASDLVLKEGEMVRITSGPLCGRTGTFQRIKGRRAKQFIVNIPGIAAAITACVTASQIEKV